ncbi:MAG: YbaK/EbsC family protein, partial [Candidatus Aenigmatarchaeota archaeon]
MENIEKIILQLLRNKKIKYEVFEHKPVHTCEEMARVLNTALERIAKSMIVKTNEGNFVLIVLPGNKTLDLTKLAKVLDVEKLMLASSQEVLKIAKCKVGCVYPLGNLMKIKTYFDKDLLNYDFVFLNPGVHTKSIKIDTKKLVDLVNPRIIEFKKEMKEKNEKEELGITVRKNENFSDWYTQVVRKAELCDYATVKGFIVFMPYGYSIWEKIANFIDKRLKETGHKNAYFPALIPERFLKKEAEHFRGFTPEVFWVTHAGDNKLEERLAIRPTSETIAYDSYAKCIRKLIDLPLL